MFPYSSLSQLVSLGGEYFPEKVTGGRGEGGSGRFVEWDFFFFFILLKAKSFSFFFFEFRL